MPAYYRSDLAEIRVEVTGVPLDKEGWDMFEGADPVAEGVTVFPAGGPQVALGGLPKWTPGTVERLWSEALAGAYKTLVGVCGFAPITVSYIQLAANKVPTGVIDTYSGVLKSVERPKYKSDESTDAFLKLTFDVDGSVQ